MKFIFIILILFLGVGTLYAFDSYTYGAWLTTGTCDLSDASGHGNSSDCYYCPSFDNTQEFQGCCDVILGQGDTYYALKTPAGVYTQIAATTIGYSWEEDFIDWGHGIVPLCAPSGCASILYIVGGDMWTGWNGIYAELGCYNQTTEQGKRINWAWSYDVVNDIFRVYKQGGLVYTRNTAGNYLNGYSGLFYTGMSFCTGGYGNASNIIISAGNVRTSFPQIPWWTPTTNATPTMPVTATFTYTNTQTITPTTIETITPTNTPIPRTVYSQPFYMYAYNGAPAADNGVTGMIEWMTGAVTSTALNGLVDTIHLDNFCFVTVTAAGNPVPNATVFPRPMKTEVAVAHNAGLRVELYTDMGNTTTAGTYQYVTNYAEYFGANNIDSMAADTIYLLPTQTPEVEAQNMVSALVNNSSGYPVTYQVWDGSVNSYDWGYLSGVNAMEIDSWATWNDFINLWTLTTSVETTDAIPFGPQYGYMNMMGLALPCAGWTTGTAQSVMNMECFEQSEIVFGNDTSTYTAADYNILTNTELLAIDRDSACIPGTKIHDYGGNVQVWGKQLSNANNYAVLFFNNSTTGQLITFYTSDMGGSSYFNARDLWAHANMGPFTGGLLRGVPPHSADMIVVNFATVIPTATITPTSTPAAYYAVACGDTNSAWAYGMTFTADNDSIWNHSSYHSVYHNPIKNTPYQQLWNFQNQGAIATDITYTVSVGAGIRYDCYFLLSSFIGTSYMNISINGTPQILGLNVYQASGNQNYWAYTSGPYRCYDNGGIMRFDFSPVVSAPLGIYSRSFVNGIYIIAGAATSTPSITPTKTSTKTITATSTSTPTASPTFTITPTWTPALYNYYINCGQPTATVVANGITWSVDKAYPGSPSLGDYGWFNTNSAVYVHTTNVAHPSTPYSAIFADYSKSTSGSVGGSMVWGFDVPYGYYMVTLSWVDWMSTGKGQNVQNVLANGSTITGLQYLDVYATAGSGILYQTVVIIHYTTWTSLQVGFYPQTGKSFINAITIQSFDPNQVYLQHIKTNTAYAPGIILSH